MGKQVDRTHQKMSTALLHLLASPLRPHLSRRRRRRRTNNNRPQEGGQGIRVTGAQGAGSDLLYLPRRSKDDSSSRIKHLSNHVGRIRALSLPCRLRRQARALKGRLSSRPIPRQQHAQNLARCHQMRAAYLRSKQQQQQQQRLRIEPLHRTARLLAAAQAQVYFQEATATIRMLRKRTRHLRVWTA